MNALRSIAGFVDISLHRVPWAFHRGLARLHAVDIRNAFPQAAALAGIDT
jgi:hypothetical protein